LTLAYLINVSFTQIPPPYVSIQLSVRIKIIARKFSMHFQCVPLIFTLTHDGTDGTAYTTDGDSHSWSRWDRRDSRSCLRRHLRRLMSLVLPVPSLFSSGPIRSPERIGQ